MSVPQVQHVHVPTNREWRKSSASGAQNDCVEATFVRGEEGDMTFAAIRDSKAVASGGGTLVLPLVSFGRFVRGASQLA